GGGGAGGGEMGGAQRAGRARSCTWGGSIALDWTGPMGPIGRIPSIYRFSNGDPAGPAITVPSGAKREPWHGQSHVFSASFQAIRQPMCVQTAEIFHTSPRSSRWTATFSPADSITRAAPRGTDRTDFPSAPANRLRRR